MRALPSPPAEAAEAVQAGRPSRLHRAFALGVAAPVALPVRRQRTGAPRGQILVDALPSAERWLADLQPHCSMHEQRRDHAPQTPGSAAAPATAAPREAVFF